MGAEDMQGRPQRTTTPPPVGEPSGVVDLPAIQHADPPGMVAHGSGEASTAGHPGTEPDEPMLDTGREAGLPHRHPMGYNPRVAWAPPPWRTWRITLTQARREGRHHGTHLQPARSQRPGKSHPTHPNVRLAGKRRPADTTATGTL